MKKIVILSISLLGFVKGFAQNLAVNDSVETGAGYANQVFYDLATGLKTESAHTTWDLGFKTDVFSASIWTNNVSTQVRVYPGGAASEQNFTAAWDTTGNAAWQRILNGETSWEDGGFQLTGTGHPDYGWGNYDNVSHNITGDSLYLYSSNGVWKKLWIVIKLSVENKYVIRTANLDGSNDVTDTLDINPYVAKTIAYYKIGTAGVVDREPADWDLLFSRYNGVLAPPFNLVTGVLSNKGVEVAMVTGVNDVATFEDTTGVVWNDALNAIGDDWKTPPPPVWVIQDSLVFFITNPAGEVWKFVLTNFTGSSSGRYVFWKKLLGIVGVEENQSPVVATVYPNPVEGQPTTLVYTLAKPANKVAYTVYDLAGKLIDNQQLNGNAGLHTVQLGTEAYAPGMYLVNLSTATSTQTFKLIVK